MQDLKPGMLIEVTNPILTEDTRIWHLLILEEEPTHWVTRMVYNSAKGPKDYFRIEKLYLENRSRANQLKILSEI
jgi:hypothetical protein